ncbi:MAG: DUF554 domain-containing protein [Lachnospiraceae bacterium]|nr:DUF554 domain-containing protein [Lachnospiraceae bacterium]
MIGLGTIFNMICIVFGGTIGCLAGNRLKGHVQETIMDVTGIAIMMLGIGGTLSQMLTIENGVISTQNTIMMMICLAVGAIIGEFLQIEEKVYLFGEWLKKKSSSSGDNQFVTAFVAASCSACIGAMAIIGAIAEGTTGDHSILFSKGIIDIFIICSMSISLGKGCIFSAIPVGILQGTVTIIAYFAGNFMTDAALSNLSYVGHVLIFCVGLNLIREKQIRVANALPAVVIAIIWGFFL